MKMGDGIRGGGHDRAYTWGWFALGNARIRTRGMGPGGHHVKLRTLAQTLTVICLLAVGFALQGCAAGPGHTRAAGAGVGAVSGALIGADVAGRGNRGTGALLGGLLGYVVGSDMGDNIARDQENRGRPGTRKVRRRVMRPRQVTVYEEVIIEEEVPCGR